MSAAWNPSRWLNAPRGSFKPAPGVLVAPHLQLVRPVTGAQELDVWVADQLTLQIEVAVKFAPQEGDSAALPAPGTRHDAPTGGEVHRFLRQARCAARLGDPHLVQILEQGKVKGIPFLVMELLEGMSLSQRLHSGPLALADAQAVLNQVAGVLARAHPLGLWHGSLCPEHLFSSEDAGQLFVKVANLGDVSSETWANDPASRLAPDAPSRKQGYLSPEQLQQGTGSGAAADLWALGVTLYELLTTTLPFEAPTSAALSVAICNGRFAPPSHYRADLPPGVDAWFARVFAPQQGARLLDPSELAREFGRALGASPPEVLSFAAPRAPDRGVADALVGDTLVADVEGDGFEEGDERTVRWDAPSEWQSPESSGPPPLPSQLPREAELTSAQPAEGGPPPLPDRPPSSRPPPPFPGYAPTLAFPAPRASTVSSPVVAAVVLPGRAFPIGSVPRRPVSGSAATPGVAGPAIRPSATPLTLTAPSAQVNAVAHRSRISKGRGMLAGMLIGSMAALLAWGLLSRRERADLSAEASASQEVLPAPLVRAEAAEGRLRAAPRPPAARPIDRAENLVILKTDELPRAPDETVDDESSESAGGRAIASISGSANTPAAGSRPPAMALNAKVPAPKSEARPSSSGNSTLYPGSNASQATTKPRAPTPPRATPPRGTHQRSDKHASADCNPPYFFDKNNIRRLKLECL